ncbi:hypothetical protein [Ammoniphilus sp. YIM 78166]|uniref:hypothetical protein n=1 Tax=Ammoniphilus sp. YIM 78166 TaxID=1644106 RepID=UPI00143185D0|nr:hypothetical protein [Ammoniphilus sp. YIM 78166]
MDTLVFVVGIGMEGMVGLRQGLRASYDGFGALIRASAGFEGIIRGVWCPDPGFSRI